MLVKNALVKFNALLTTVIAEVKMSPLRGLGFVDIRCYYYVTPTGLICNVFRSRVVHTEAFKWFAQRLLRV
jgi:hypothetical protein